MKQEREFKEYVRGQNYDLLVIGGGIYGCCLAWLAAANGLKVALLEKGDFGGGASANSLKIIHGGLRYLQSLDLPRMRESIYCRRLLLKMLPEIISPHLFMVPTLRWGLRCKSVMRAAMIMNDLISWDRNRGVLPSQRIARGQIFCKGWLQNQEPDLAKEGYTGAALWGDGFAANTERVTLAFALAARRAGAFVANYLAVKEMQVANGRVTGVLAQNVLNGETLAVAAKAVVNMAGAWAPTLGPRTSRWGRWVKAYNIVVDRPLFREYGVGLECMAEYRDEQAVMRRGKRNYFFAPWRGGTMVGTIYKWCDEGPEGWRLTEGEIGEFVGEINGIYPAARLRSEEVTFAQVGVMPAARGREALPCGDTQIFTDPNAAGYWGVRSVKYTTALATAEKVLKSVVPGKCCSVEKLTQDFVQADMVRSPDGDVNIEALALKARLLMMRPDALDEEAIVYAVREELTVKLSDLILRRTGLGSFKFPGREVLLRCSAIMARELGWDSERRGQEEAEVVAYYRRVGIDA